MVPRRIRATMEDVVTLVILFSAVCLGVVSAEDVYTHEFAVHVRGGGGVAHRLATKYGYENKGQIGALEDHYLFTHHSISKRSAVPSSGQHMDLSKEPEVEMFEQQVARKRVKRTAVKLYNFSDPQWSSQWYLDGNSTNNSRPRASMKVQEAWIMGYTGHNVVLTIMDDGLEHNHTDIMANYDTQASYDFVSEDVDPMPRYILGQEDNMHGTRCAGEIVMHPDNSRCGVGVAFNASIGAIRMLDGLMTDQIEAKSISFNLQHIDIFSSSWGPEDGGVTVEGPGYLARRAFEKGVAMGRSGKGAIYVWASGNGGIGNDDCNADGYANSIYTLTVSSATEHQDRPFYSENCAASLASTFSSGDKLQKKVLTTDLHNSCVWSFTGTSASAPMAAGICALVLEANGNLTWRDMQYLVVVTAKRHDLEGEWTRNGAGHEVSHWFGFGLMDAAAMVERAKTWETLPEQFTCTKFANILQQRYTYFQYMPPDYETSMEVSQCHEPSGESIKHLEHVQLTLSLYARKRGRVVVVLTSPSGTVSTLLSRRNMDRNRRGLTRWTLMSVHFWGENPLGIWNLRIGDGTDNRLYITSAKLTLRGTTFLPTTLHSEAAPTEHPQEVAERASVPEVISVSRRESRAVADETSSWDSSWWWSSSNWDSVPECDSECLYGCSGSLPTDCYQCRHYKDRATKACVTTCPDGQYAPPQLHIRCRYCNKQCQTCNGPQRINCLSCPDGKFLSSTNTCEDGCESGYYADTFFGMCRQCAPLCTSCTGDENQCTACVDTAVLRSAQCVTRCMDSEYLADGRCLPCHVSCFSCDGPTSTDCTACYNDQVHKDMMCVFPNECGQGYYISKSYDANSRQCYRCHSTCLDCQGPSFIDCVSCPPGSFLGDGACLQTCENGKYLDNHGACQSCGQGCTMCVDEQHCILCSNNMVLVEEEGGMVCCDGCPDGTYSMEGECFGCHSSCETCSGGGIMDCTRCKQSESSGHTYLLEGACVNYCPRGYFQLEFDNVFTCAMCDESCRTCSGPGDGECIQCEDGLVMDDVSHSCREQPEFTCAAPNCDTCVPGNNNACQRCLEGYYLENIDCSVSCPDGKFPQPATRTCELCHPSCKTCEVDAGHCASCEEEYYLDPDENLCVTECRLDMFADGNKMCTFCHSDCSSCTGPSENECTGCIELTAFLLGSQCVRKCPEGQYGDELTGTCRSCHPSCLTCTGPGDHECASCQGDYSNNGGYCRSHCDDRSYPDGNECSACHELCQTCSGPASTDCLSCSYYLFLNSENRCMTDCPERFYPDYESNVCRKCHPSCQTCLDSRAQDCIMCSPDTYMLLQNGQLCVEECPVGFYESEEMSFRDCRQCSIECKDCDETYLNCISCYDGTYLYQQRCFSTCPSGFEEDSVTNHCIQRDRLCPLFCLECDKWGDCTVCNEDYVEYFGECVKESDMACRRNEYIVSFNADGSAECASCHGSCATCLGPQDTDCVSCHKNFHFEGSRCVSTCGEGKYKDDLLGECFDCHPTCSECEQGSPIDCTSCDNGMHLSVPNRGSCQFGCPAGQYAPEGGEDRSACADCHDPNCYSCVGPEQADCLMCNPEFLRTENGRCVSSCPNTTYEYILPEVQEGNECRPCHLTCLSCNGPGPTECTACEKSLVLLSGQCLQDCDERYFADEHNHCVRCNSTCQTCSGPLATNCVTCRAGQLLQVNECVDQCEGSHYQMLGLTCEECDISCQECSDYGPFDCTECYSGYELEDGVCYNRCGGGRYYDWKTKTCGPCSSACKECYGPGPDQCIDCHNDMRLEKIDRNHTRCIPCCASTDSDKDEDCCDYCKPNIFKCTNSHVHKVTSQSRVKVQHIGTVVVSCLFVVILFFLVFGLLQARTHGKLCWSHKYSKVPSYSYNTKDKYVTLGKPTDDYYEEDIYGEVSEEEEEDVEEPDTFQTIGGAAYRSIDKNGVIDHL